MIVNSRLGATTPGVGRALVYGVRNPDARGLRAPAGCLTLGCPGSPSPCAALRRPSGWVLLLDWLLARPGWYAAAVVACLALGGLLPLILRGPRLSPFVTTLG